MTPLHNSVRPWWRVAVTGLMAVGLLLVCSLSAAQAQPTRVALWWVEFNQPDELGQLAAAYDVWEVDHAQRRALVQLNDADAAALGASYSMTLAADQSPLSPRVTSAEQTGGIPGYACYRTLDETSATLEALAAAHPNLARLVDIGDSWNKIRFGPQQGHDLRVFVLTNAARGGDKFRLTVIGALHAREYVTAELALRFAEELLQGYGTDPAITWLLDHGEVHILPHANPDGRVLAEEGLLWRKNTNNDLCSNASPPNAYGVDLNRNSSFQWNACIGCSSDQPCAETYRGAHPASEPEVKAIQAYLASIYPDMRAEALDAAAPDTTPGIFISLHSYGRLVLYPWGWTSVRAPNAEGLETLARRFADRLDYHACQAGTPFCLYPTDGTTDDWAYGTLGVPSFTFELGTAFFQACSDFEETIAPRALATLHNALNVAALPYQLPAGPRLEMMKTTGIDGQGGAQGGEQKRVRVTVTAVQTLGTPVPRHIARGRLTLNHAPWDTAVPAWPLMPLDQEMDSSEETLTATIDTTCLPNGTHTLIAQAQDNAGHWGEPAFAQITVNQTRAFTVTASTGATGTSGLPLRHLLTITNTGHTTDTYRLARNLRSAGSFDMTFPQTRTDAIAPGASVQVPVDVLIRGQNKTATQTVAETVAETVAVVDVYSERSPQQCQQAILHSQGMAPVRVFLPWLPLIRPQ